MAEFNLTVCARCGKSDHEIADCTEPSMPVVFARGSDMGWKGFTYMKSPAFEQRQRIRLAGAIKDAAAASGFNCNRMMEHFLVELLQRLNIDTK